MQNLFKTNSDLLWDWCQNNKLFSSAQVYTWGHDNYYMSAQRLVRKWAEEGRIKRLDDKEILHRGLWRKNLAHLAWYEIET